MSDLYLFMQQEGRGCDYTIGCGQKLIKLQYGDSCKGVLKNEVQQIFDDHGISASGETRLSQVCILQACPEFDVQAWLNGHYEQKHQEAVDYEREQKRKQLEQLKRELGE